MGVKCNHSKHIPVMRASDQSVAHVLWLLFWFYLFVIA